MGKDHAQVNSRTPFAFTKTDTRIIKGIAILLMIALHRLKPEWMVDPGRIADITVGGTPLAFILARGGDVCIGMFAFIIGYGWASSFGRRKIHERIFSLNGGIYPKYWLALLLFCFPMRILFETVLQHQPLQLTLPEALLSLFAVTSQSCQYCWYILFFALAVLTYPLLARMMGKIPLKGAKKLILVCGSLLAVRICLARLSIPGHVGNVISHYVQWIPALLMGTIVEQEQLLQKFNDWTNRIFHNHGEIIGIGIGIILYVGKITVYHVTGRYINLDVIPLFFTMYGAICLAHMLEKHAGLAKLFAWCGDLSLYLWLTHTVLKYEPLQSIIYFPRIPILVLAASVLLVLPASMLLHKADQKLASFAAKRRGA